MGSWKITVPPQTLASPVREDQVGSIVGEAGLWDQGSGDSEGTQLGTIAGSCGQDLCEADEAPSSQGSGEAQLEKEKRRGGISHKTIEGPLYRYWRYG